MKLAISTLRWLILALVALVAIMVAGAVVVTRTPWGVQAVGRYAMSSIARGIHGRLEVGHIHSSSLLRGITIGDVSITDSAGAPFLRVDSLRASYSWRSLLAGRIVLSRLALYHPVVVVEQQPGDTLWNYQRILGDTTATASARRLVRFSDVTVHDGDATVAFPYEQKTPIQPSDTARMIMRRVGRGLQRVIRFRGIEAALPDVLWESPAEPGRLIRVGRLSGQGYIWATPFEMRQAAGTVALHDSVVAFDAPDVRLPATQGSLVGQVVMHRSRNDYDVQIAGRRLDFSDLRWLYPKLPESGGGSADIRIMTVPRGTLWLISDARLHAPRTNVAGSFGVVTGDTLYFTQVDLRASPFDLKLVRSVLPGKLPIRGLLVGTVVVQGPLSALRTHGDLRLSGGPAAMPSAVRWSGTLDMRGPYGARDFRADLAGLDLKLLRGLDPALPLSGEVSGRIAASGRLDRSMRVVADLEHVLPGTAPSHVTGSGAVSLSRNHSTFDLRLEAVSLALNALTEAFPALKRLRLGGDARGPVSVKGSLRNLQVDADLQTPAGRLAVNGRFDLASRRPTYRASGAVSAFKLDRILAGLPATSVSGRYRVEGAGTTLADATTALAVDVTGGRMGGVALQGGRVRLSLDHGLARVDTLRLATAAGTLEGEGRFGVGAGRTGTLTLRVDADSLGALQPLFFADSLTPGAGSVRHMGGTLRGQATLSGGLDAFDVTGDAALLRASFGQGAVARGNLRFSATALGSARPAWTLQGSADSLSFGALLLPTSTLHADYASPSGSVAFAATGADGGDYRLAGNYRLAGDTADMRLADLRFGAGPGAWQLEAPVNMRLLHGTLQTDSLRITRAGGGTLHAGGRLAWAARAADSAALARPLAFQLALDRAPLQDFLGLVGAESPAAGRITGRVDVSGSAGEPRIDGSLAVEDPRFEELHLDRLDATLAYADGRADGRVQALAGGSPVLVAEGRLPMDLSFMPARRFPDQPLQATIRTDSLPASLVTTLLDGFSGVRGRVDGQVQVAGTVRAPRFDGELRLRDGSGSWLPSGVTYSDANGTFRMAGDGAVQVDASGRADQGTADVTGRVVIGSDWTNPRFELAARLMNFLATRRRDADITASGDVRLAGRYRAPIISGHIRVDRGVLNLDQVWRQYNIVALDDSLLFDMVDTSVVSVRNVLSREMESDFVHNLTVDSFTVDVGRNDWLRGKQMNVEVSGELGIFYRRAADDLRLDGTLSAVRGNYLLYGGRRFDVKSGTIEFVGTNTVDPNLDITAVYRARSADTGQPLNIQADVTGTLTDPRIALSGDQPSISQSDLVSYLIFGVPTYRLTPGQSQTIQAATEALASTIQGYLSSGLETVGRTIGLDYVSLTSGDIAPNDQPPGLFSMFSENLAGTQLEVGRYVRDDLFLAVSGSRPMVGSTSFIRPGARLEWRFHPTWTGEFFWDERAARVPSLGYTLDQTLAQQKVLGFYLYREWGY